ncbi:galactose-3-O-sulfotransferase 2 isoform X1 [Osmerus eperlanus]|uniref:galactose-3-O-sulfotransferase 2 isoform X1 n=1 Tax=Osmerus eperlanus TaxID=29151 RepID=UPI002E10A03C
MPPSPNKSPMKQAVFSQASSLPCPSRWMVLLQSHLGNLLRLMMVLMVLLTATQILGVVFQCRNDKLMDVQFSMIQRALPLHSAHTRPSTETPEERGERRGGRRGQRSQDAEPRQEVRKHQEELFSSSNPSLPRGLDELVTRILKSKTNTRRVQLHAIVQSLDLANELGSPNSPAQSRPPSLHSKSQDSFPGFPQNIAEVRTCRPKKHIFFLKTHKTASSTILNILYRYGDSQNLTFALPYNMHSQLFYPNLFASYFVEGEQSRSKKKFHIMCNHLRLNIPEVRKVMPEDSFYFSILRNPVDMMESVFMYYKSSPAFVKSKDLDDFLGNGSSHFNMSLPGNHYARNLLSYDFGFDNNIAADDPGLVKMASNVITAIQHDFQLILISEYFDESMILLKYALCWSLDDVVSFRLNSRNQGSRRTLSSLTADKIRTWNALDWRVYLHFNATFWRRVDILVGRKEMKREVAQLQERRAQLTRTCLKEGGAVDPSQVKDTELKPFQYGAAVIQGYNLNPGLDGPDRTFCQKLITPELMYTKALYTKQFPELAAKHVQAARMAASKHQARMNQSGPGKAKEA